jgi:hypothetical protein
MAKSKRKVKCCTLCGRDTRAYDGVCAWCRGQRPLECRTKETDDKDKAEGSCMEIFEDDYHGEMIRDDL